MRLEAIVIENFRGYTQRQTIPIDNLTTFVGRNDIGKSTLLDALAVFFEHPLGKIDHHDVNKAVLPHGQLRIGCIFGALPEKLTLESSDTSFEREYLLNHEQRLEIHRVYDYSEGKLAKPKIIAVALHPTVAGADDLLQQKSSTLRERAKTRLLSGDLRSNVQLRHAIWRSYDNLGLALREIQLDREDAKSLWDSIQKQLPEYALFRSDRASNDDDNEVQDPLKTAISQALAEVRGELATIEARVRKHAEQIATQTIEKLHELDSALASQLKPQFRADPKWDSLFKISLTDQDDIPLNKRGSGVRRLVLFSFFRAEAERRLAAKTNSDIIYAIEEPETAQHPAIQHKLIDALLVLSEQPGVQILLTTHEPALLSAMPAAGIRFITKDAQYGRVVSADRGVWQKVAADIGVKPDAQPKVVIFVEGITDIPYIRVFSRILNQRYPHIIDISNDNRVGILPIGGGGNLQHYINHQYFDSLQIPVIYILDNDPESEKKHNKYADVYKALNQRPDGSRVYITKKREIENYLHAEVIQNEFHQKYNIDVHVEIDDNCDVEKGVIVELERLKAKRRPNIKDFLSTQVLNNTTYIHLEDRNCTEEWLAIFSHVAEIANQPSRQVR
jgi:putative ATP-dependent endonuclease of OLD family